MKKRNIITVCAIVLVLSLMIGATYAYLTDNGSATNTFTVGKIDIDFAEPSWDDATDGKDLLPGDSLQKDPIVTATEGDSYMRIKMEIKDTATDAVITDAARVNAILSTLRYDSSYSTTTNSGTLAEGTQYSTTDLASYPNTNTTDFTYDTGRATVPGVRYYNYTANGGKLVEDAKAILFTNVIVPSDFGSTEITALGGNYTIVLTAQAIQFDNVASASAAYTALD